MKTLKMVHLKKYFKKKSTMGIFLRPPPPAG